MFRRIKDAYNVFYDYCLSLPVSFKEKEISRHAFEEGTDVHMDRFYSGWMKDVNT